MNRTEHLLSILAEECAEVAQRCSKALRFGLEEVQPGQLSTNAERIVREYNDLVAVIEMLNTELGLQYLLHSAWRQAISEKKSKVEQFLEYSRKCGTLTDCAQHNDK